MSLYASVISSSRDLRRDDRGASMVEYAFLLALIAIIALVAVTAFGQGVSDQFDRISDSVQAA